jgi:leader peptidase (prepilin peptidase) / N-methyltransferase
VPPAVPICALFGLLIGSFLNVVIARVPDGRSIVRPGSACPRCAHTLSWWENLPVLSWVLLRARCRSCRLPISARYPLVELLTAVLFGLVAWRVGARWALPAMLFFTAASVALAFIDLDTRRLPDPIVFTTQAAVAIGLVAAALADGTPRKLVGVALGAALASGFLFLLHVAKPGGMGFGDVKYAVAIGAVLGWTGLGNVVVGLMAGFLIGSVIGIAQAVRAGKLRGATMPFGPSLAAGALFALLWGRPLLDWYTGLSG